MLKLVKICGRQQLESIFSHLGPISNLTVLDVQNVTIRTDDGRFPAITKLKDPVFSQSKLHTLFLLRIHFNTILPIICRCHTFKATK